MPHNRPMKRMGSDTDWKENVHKSGKGKNLASVLKYPGKMWYNFAVPHFAVPNFATAESPPPGIFFWCQFPVLPMKHTPSGLAVKMWHDICAHCGWTFFFFGHPGTELQFH